MKCPTARIPRLSLCGAETMFSLINWHILLCEGQVCKKEILYVLTRGIFLKVIGYVYSGYTTLLQFSLRIFDRVGKTKKYPQSIPLIKYLVYWLLY